MNVRPGDVVWLSTQLGADESMAYALAHAVPGLGVALTDWWHHVHLPRVRRSACSVPSEFARWHVELAPTGAVPVACFFQTGEASAPLPFPTPTSNEARP